MTTKRRPGPGRPKGSPTRPERSKLRFRRSEIERAIRSVTAMGLPVSRVEIDPVSGRIVIGTPGAPPALDGRNPWDEALDAANKDRAP